MPNRILKESICTSEDLDKLSPWAEILFYRLMVKADDFGTYHGNPAIVKSTCFPLKSDEIKLKQVETWLAELSNAGLIRRYQAEDDRQYLQFVKWDKHQQVRAKKPKFPQFDSTCNQLISDDSKCPRNPIQSNTIQCNSEAAKPQREKKEFVPPTKDEIAEYCRERRNGVDPQKVYDYYSAANWKDSSGKPVKNWKQKVIAVWEPKAVPKQAQNLTGGIQFFEPGENAHVQ